MKRRLTAGTATGILLLSCALGFVPSSPASAVAAQHATAGDFDGDGKPDLAVGAPRANEVRVQYTHARPGGHPVRWFHGEGNFGTTLAVGDFDGDGISDLVVGAPDILCGGQQQEDCGGIGIYRGSHHGLHAEAFFLGPYDGDEPYSLGSAIAAGDVNGDGYTDLVASIPEQDFGVRIYHGGPNGLLAGQFDSLNAEGPTALVLADVNGDGHPELITGSSFADGILIFRGTVHGIHPTSPQSITAHQVGVFQLLGEELAAGDVNGDGYADVLAGAPRDTYFPHHLSPGSVVLLTGGPHGLSAAHHQTFSERSTNSRWRPESSFGAAITTVAVPGRPYRDVVVGAAGDRVGGHHAAGAVYVFRGTAHGIRRTGVQRITLATHGIVGVPGKGTGFGAAVYAAHSGHAVSIGAPGSDLGAHDGGLVDVLRVGTTGAVPTTQSIAGPDAGGGLGAVIR